MSEAIMSRAEPLWLRQFANDGVLLRPAAPANRLSLRADEKAFGKIKSFLSFDLPQKPKSSFSNADCHALWLGPDEWLIIEQGEAKICDKLLGAGNADFSAVDISHRNTAIIVSGVKAEMVLNAGCPQDLSLAAFPVGAASRTILAKAEIVLWRTGQNEFRAECWRSFSDYCWKFLVEAAKST